MNIERLQVSTDAVVPLIAALPYRIEADEAPDAVMDYDPTTQRTIFAGRDYSTCREDESVWPLFGKSKSDTKKDD